MPEQVRVEKRATERTEPEAAPVETAKAETADREALKAETEAMLDRIDAALEEQGLNTEEAAQAQVADYKQVGGE